MDVKFDQKFDACKDHLLNEKEAVTQSQLRKLKTKSKASSSLISIDGAVKGISKGNPSAANSELGRVKSLITKLNKLLLLLLLLLLLFIIFFFVDKSLAGWKAVEEFESDELAGNSEDEKKNSDQPRDERSSRLERRSVKMRLVG